MTMLTIVRLDGDIGLLNHVVLKLDASNSLCHCHTYARQWVRRYSLRNPHNDLHVPDDCKADTTQRYHHRYFIQVVIPDFPGLNHNSEYIVISTSRGVGHPERAKNVLRCAWKPD